VGEHLATVLARHFSKLENLRNATVDELSKINDLGPVVAESIYTYFHDPETERFLKKLSDAGVVFPVEESVAGSKPLDGWTIVITGTLEDYSRSQAKKILEGLGARVASSVSPKTDAVLVGANPGSKYDRAIELGIRIIDENDMRELAGER
jgi:DNA ligase (NAD+)